MYEQFYGLIDKPFALTPNPRFVFYSQQYREAEGQLLYGINSREGFMLVTGQPGTGKTTLCRDLIEKLDRERVHSALIFNPFLNGVEMLAALLTEFGIAVPPGGTRKDLLDRLNQFLLAQLALGKSCVAIFDEAQHLSTEFLEQIRVLSNLETDQEKLIQIVLVGQPELLDKVRTPTMAQLDQRVSIRCTLTHLDEQETDRYIHHRLNVAGARGQIRFSPRAVAEIYRASNGVPRLINLICDRALLAGYAAQTRDIGPEHVKKAVMALRGDEAEIGAPPRAAVAKRGRRALIVGGVATVIIAATAAGMALMRERAPDAETLYWRGAMATSPEDGERDLQTLITKFPQSTRVNDALLRLAQFQMARGERPAALKNLGLLGQRATTGPLRTQAVLWTARLSMDAGDTTAACHAVATQAGLDTTDVAAIRQVRDISERCSSLASAAGADSAVAQPAGTPTPTRQRDSSVAPATQPAPAKPTTPHADAAGASPSTTSAKQGRE